MNCVFCQPDRQTLVDSQLSAAFLDHFPLADGHALVVPKRHIASIWEMTDEEYMDAFKLVRYVKDTIQKTFEPRGFNVLVNCGEVAGQTIFHAHIHVIPRYAGDESSHNGARLRKLPSGRHCK
jgi:diadenosine tetraphosphate (Ap4A) HIT family hydrolase